TDSGSLVTIRLGTGTGSFTAPTTNDFPSHGSAQGIVTGDFNGDGKLDLAVANAGTQDVSVLLGNGDGTFATHVDFGAGGAVTSATAGAAVVRLGKGAGALDVANSFPIGNNPAKLTTVDVDRDGHLDLAATVQGDDEVAVLTGSGTGAFATPAGFSVLHAPLGIAT